MKQQEDNQHEGIDSKVLSVEGEISSLETKLSCLVLEDDHSSNGEKEDGPESDGYPELKFPPAVQNELKILLKTIGCWSADAVNCKERKQELVRIRSILQKPLKESTITSASLSDNSVSILLSYLKLLSETCPPAKPTLQNAENDAQLEDYYWSGIIRPIFADILKFLNVVFQRCFGKLNSPSSSGGVYISHHGTGFAFHQQLGILQKGVRTFLVYMKRLLTNLNSNVEQNSDITQSILNIFREFCALMIPAATPFYDIKTDFDIGLDIRCNIGVGFCYLLCFLRYPDAARIQSFFNLPFTNYSDVDVNVLNNLMDLEKEVLNVVKSDVNKIALAFGILNTWLEDKHDPTLYYIIGSNVLSIQHGVKEAVNLGSSRVMEIWTDKLARSEVPSDVLKTVSNVFRPLELFCFMYMPGHIDAVKNCCRNIISSLSRIYDRLDEENYDFPDKQQQSHGWISNFLKTILEKPIHIKWIALACVAKNTRKALTVLELDTGLPEKLLTVQRTFKSAANDTYVALMGYHFHNTSSRETWEKTWIDPLFATQPNQNNESNWPQKKNIISNILNSEKLRLKNIQELICPLLLYVVRKMNSGETGSRSNKCEELEKNNGDDGDVEASSLLAVETIKMAHELKITVNLDTEKIDLKSDTTSLEVSESFRGIVPLSTLQNWLWSESPQVRLAGLSLLVETRKTSEEFTEQEFTALKIFLKYNLHSQNPAFRQQFVSYFKKFVRRLGDSEALARKTKKMDSVRRYESFFQWLWDFLTKDEGLFTGASFGRRCQALECLSELLQNYPNCIVGLSEADNAQYLRWLTDSYENNKIQALFILERLPIKEFEDEEFCKNVFDEAMTLCKSVKPPDSVAGRYLMTLLMKKMCGRKGRYSSMDILESLYYEIRNIYKRVESTTLIQVSSETPMYGCLRCIRMILQNTSDFKQAEYISKYRSYIAKLLQLCFQLDAVLFPVLGSAAPEGFLPKDSDIEKNQQVVRSLGAQMLLVCAWRSMKEICLLMADMCSLFPVEGETFHSTTFQDSSQFLLTFQQVSDIGDHLLYLLKNLMHRGVFEQVFVGFKQLAARLWRSTSLKLNSLPEKWLHDAMDQEHISSKSITRRSAGLPFIFQALLSTECDNEAFFHKWVQRLLIFDESPDMTPVRIHSMNVLRGLFRDASFSSAMMSIVPHGLRMAFRGLKSSDWTERNSGLMLYGAVMRRTFGAKLNLMNAPTFFRKFPQMYDFLLEELDTCIILMESSRIVKRDPNATNLNTPPVGTCDFTFHLLLLLSSFTSSSRLEDTHFKLDAFISKLRKCGESNDMEVRKLSAKALIPFLVSTADKQSVMKTIVREIESNPDQMTQNRLHGVLCQFLTISEHLPVDTTCRNANAEVITQFLTLVTSAPIQKLFKSPPILETLMKIVTSFMPLWSEKDKILHDSGIIVRQYNERFAFYLLRTRNVVPSLPVSDRIIARENIRMALENSTEEVFLESIYTYFTDASPTSRSYVEEFLQLFLEGNSRCSQILFGESDKFNDGSVVVLVAFIESYLRRIQEEFSKFPGTTLELHYLKFLEAFPHTMFNCVNDEYDDMINRLIRRMLEFCEEKEGKFKTTTIIEIRAAAFTVLGKLSFASRVQLPKGLESIICEVVLKWSASGVDEQMRFAVARSFPSVPFPNMLTFSVINQAKLWASIFILAQDDEGLIRQVINGKLKEALHGKPVCDRKSLETIVSLFLKHYFVRHPVEGVLLLVGLLQRNDFECEVETADDDTEERLFDKSEMNMYYEHRVLAKTIINEVQAATKNGSISFTQDGNVNLSLDQTNLYNLLVNKPLIYGKTEELTLKQLCLKDKDDDSYMSGKGTTCSDSILCNSSVNIDYHHEFELLFKTFNLV